MQPYVPPPMPPPQKGTNVGLIIGLVVGLFFLLLIGVFFCAGVMGYMRAKRAARYSSYYSSPYSTTYSTSYASPYSTPTSTSTAAGNSETYITTNGLVTAHYPADFAAKSIDSGTLMLSRNNSDGTDEVVEVAGVPNPISDDVNEFSRVLVQAMKKNIESTTTGKWVETSRRRTTCFKTYAGLQIEGTYTAGITKENVKICYFMRPNKGYELKTIVPAMHESRDLPVLQGIVDATEIH